jgi:hypothetical protein
MRHNMKNKFLLTGFGAMLTLSLFSKEIQGFGQRISSGDENVQKVMAACSTPSGAAQLDINNVRTIIYTGGDMWWDLTSNGYYRIPKDGIASSLFAGSLWLGGLDAGGQLKVAAMTYRQSGVDFWPGPLDTVNTSVDQVVCNQYDKIFQMSRRDVDTFLTYGVITSSLNSWPGNGDVSLNQGKYLAPFQDVDGDGIYNPGVGDYPDYDVNTDGVDPSTGKCKHKLFGDKTLWWVFNDKGDVHSETGGLAMGVEVRAQAFAFKTDNEVNDMTFYSYEIINRSSYTLTQTYMTVWNDADLGYYNDDLVGCDVSRGLGFIFNGDGYDEDGGGATGYKDTPPSIGCDFFQGPLADPGDGVNNDRDSVFDASGNAIAPNIDEPGEQCIMSGFFYYNNNTGNYPPPTLNPSNASQFYGYMTGFWRDGSPFTYGGSGYNSGGVPCKFVFPGTTDPAGYGTNFVPQSPWYAYTPPSGPAVDLPADKRFLESAGPFSLQPGAVNYITFGMPWARSTTLNSPWSSVELLLSADDKAQALFDNCFNVINGPDAPDLTVQELNNELIVYLSNKPTSNNFNESYEEVDPTINPPLTIPNLDKSYNFEGFIVYQLKDGTVNENDLYNQDKARVIAQCDIKNGFGKLINYEFDASIGASVPKVKVDAADAGLFKSFKVTSDKFATGDARLVNHKTYYFMAVSYAFNQYVEYKPDQPPVALNDPTANYYGQKLPFLRGRRNIKKYTAIPHNPTVENSGTIQNSSYGTGPKLTRVEGQGNGGNILDLSDEAVNAILAAGEGRVLQPSYANGRGPIKVKVVDPLNVPNGDFTIKILGGTNSNLGAASVVNESFNNDSMWVLSFTPASGTNYSGPTKVYSSKSLKIGNEQIIPEMGISVYVEQVPDPADGGPTFGIPKKSDILDASITFTDPIKTWLTAVPDGEGCGNPENWIYSGSASEANNPECNDYVNTSTGTAVDPDQIWESVLGGTWAPYRMCARAKISGAEATLITAPAFEKPPIQMAGTSLRTLSSVDIVVTADKSKWTRACVLEENNIPAGSFPANTEKLSLRGDASVDKNGNVGDGVVTNDPDDADFIGATGMGWFPGYAINLETGERLNIAFGENSTFGLDNGRDMIWNPTSNVYSPGTFSPVFGGMHYVYVFGHNGDGVWPAGDPNGMTGELRDVPRYDFGRAIYKLLSNGNVNKKAEVYKDAMWVNIPVVSSSYSNISQPFKNLNIPCDVKVRLRVPKPYRYGYATHHSPSITAIPATFSLASLVVDTSLTTPLNGNFPMYRFNTSDIATVTESNTTAVNALDLINVVPNPYYGTSSYESSRLDNKIKITNLPDNCKVRIYTLNGTLIRTFNKDSDSNRDGTNYRSSVDWDLKNQKGIPIASGLYIIHIDAPGIGEKIIKWFGVLRPFDLQSY